MFKIEELASSLIRSGKLRDAIPVFSDTMDEALINRVIKNDELLGLYEEFCNLLLMPDAKAAASLGDKLIRLEIRIPGKVLVVGEAEFEKNSKASRGTN